MGKEKCAAWIRLYSVCVTVSEGSRIGITWGRGSVVVSVFELRSEGWWFDA